MPHAALEQVHSPLYYQPVVIWLLGDRADKEVHGTQVLSILQAAPSPMKDAALDMTGKSTDRCSQSGLLPAVSPSQGNLCLKEAAEDNIDEAEDACPPETEQTLSRPFLVTSVMSWGPNRRAAVPGASCVSCRMPLIKAQQAGTSPRLHTLIVAISSKAQATQVCKSTGSSGVGSHVAQLQTTQLVGLTAADAHPVQPPCAVGLLEQINLQVAAAGAHDAGAVCEVAPLVDA